MCVFAKEKDLEDDEKAEKKTPPAKKSVKRALPFFSSGSFHYLKPCFLLLPPNPLSFPCLVSLDHFLGLLAPSGSSFFPSQIRPAELQAAELVNWNGRVSGPGQ